MQFADIVIIILLLIAIIVWIMNLIKTCPQETRSVPQIIYRFKPDLDLQFDTTNFPSTVYTQMFNGNNPTIGGYTLESGRSTLISVNNQNTRGGTISPVPINNGVS